MTETTPPMDFGLGTDAVAKRLLTQCRKIDEEYLPTLVALAQENIARLPSGVVCRAQDIFGREFWELLENWPRRLAGEVLARLVVNRQLPLRFASCPRCTTKWYMHL